MIVKCEERLIDQYLHFEFFNYENYEKQYFEN